MDNEKEKVLLEQGYKKARLVEFPTTGLVLSRLDDSEVHYLGDLYEAEAGKTYSISGQAIRQLAQMFGMELESYTEMFQGKKTHANPDHFTLSVHAEPYLYYTNLKAIYAKVVERGLLELCVHFGGESEKEGKWDFWPQYTFSGDFVVGWGEL